MAKIMFKKPTEKIERRKKVKAKEEREIPKVKGMEKEQGKEGVASKPSLLFSIRNKIFICFLVPIIFMIVVGVAAYQKSSDGMQDKFRESTEQTVNMIGEYIEMSNAYIEAEGMRYAFDPNLNKSFAGLMDNDPVAKADAINKAKADVISSQTTNQYISNIFLITKQDTDCISTKGIAADGRRKEVFGNISGRCTRRWKDT